MTPSWAFRAPGVGVPPTFLDLRVLPAAPGSRGDFSPRSSSRRDQTVISLVHPLHSIYRLRKVNDTCNTEPHIAFYLSPRYTEENASPYRWSTVARRRTPHTEIRTTTWYKRRRNSIDRTYTHLHRTTHTGSAAPHSHPLHPHSCSPGEATASILLVSTRDIHIYMGAHSFLTFHPRAPLRGGSARGGTEVSYPAAD